MKLIQLIYSSRSTGIGPDDIESILVGARGFNTSANVTGLLCFSAKRFLQCLEGSRSAVNEIYRRILVDRRHEGAQILRYEEIERRDFPSWSMAYVGDTAMNRVRLLRYSGDDEFKPENLAGNSARLLLLDLADSVAERPAANDETGRRSLSIARTSEST